MNILIINGPNLNLLGEREPSIYGKESLNDLIDYTNKSLIDLKVNLIWFQSNHEGRIIDKLQDMAKSCDAVIINPGGYSHSSVAILDAMKLVKCPIIEVHLTNTHSREEFRKQRITASGADFILEGLGRDTYTSAVRLLQLKKE